MSISNFYSFYKRNVKYSFVSFCSKSVSKYVFLNLSTLVMIFLHFMTKHFHHETTKFRKHENYIISFRAFVINFFFWFRLVPG